MKFLLYEHGVCTVWNIKCDFANVPRANTEIPRSKTRFVDNFKLVNVDKMFATIANRLFPVFRLFKGL
jgi:hypothetical protein